MYIDLMYSWFIGKKIQSIRINNGETSIDFFLEGCNKRLVTYGDCCSSSWIEHLEMPNNVEGATITSVTEDDMPPWDNHICEAHKEGCLTPCEHDSLRVYHTVFHTDRGDIVLEYRNDSNGYYGGNLEDAGDIPEKEI